MFRSSFFSFCQSPDSIHSHIYLIMSIECPQPKADRSFWEGPQRAVGGWRAVQANPTQDSILIIQPQADFKGRHVLDVEREGSCLAFGIQEAIEGHAGDGG